MSAPVRAPVRLARVALAKRPLPALSLPKPKEDRRGSAVFSVLAHVLVIALLVTPFAVHHEIIERPQGAGGPGPAGGGGGGRRGTGGAQEEPRERLRFVSVAPQQAPTPVEIPKPTPVPPVVTPKPVVEEKKAEPVPTPVAEPAKSVPDVSLVPGSGGGTGNDGSKGNGPGSGGGVGSGIGTGRGSGVGPGTGGGTQADYPPAPIETLLPPLPAPEKVRGFHLVAEFDVDSVGRVISFDFTPTRDGDYNKKLREVFKSYRFRPGTHADGTPIRMKAQVSFDF